MVNNELRKLYIFIGPEKTGTTSIYNMLPFQKADTQKERFYLSKYSDLKSEVNRVNSQRQDVAYIVEPTYFYSESALELCSQLKGIYDVYIVHTQRDPLKRSISHYFHHFNKGRVKTIQQAVVLFPEIIDASNYEVYSEQWKRRFDKFYTIDIDDQSKSLEEKLLEVGVDKLLYSELNSNEKLAPRSILLSKWVTKVWEFIIRYKLNKVVPTIVKETSKKIVYYGGRKSTISDQEKEFIKECIKKSTC